LRLRNLRNLWIFRIDFVTAFESENTGDYYFAKETKAGQLGK